MTKTAQNARKFIRQQRDKARGNLKLLDVKRGKNGSSFAYWAEWHAMDYIHWEMVLGFWERLMVSFEKVVADGITDEALIKRIEEVREQFVRNILQATARHSTNPIANLIEEEKVDVYRGVVGEDSLDGDSLAYLLSTLKRT